MNQKLKIVIFIGIILLITLFFSIKIHNKYVLYMSETLDLTDDVEKFEDYVKILEDKCEILIEKCEAGFLDMMDVPYAYDKYFIDTKQGYLYYVYEFHDGMTGHITEATISKKKISQSDIEIIKNIPDEKDIDNKIQKLRQSDDDDPFTTFTTVTYWEIQYNNQSIRTFSLPETVEKLLDVNNKE